MRNGADKIQTCIDQTRNQEPRDAEHLWLWLYAFTGVKLARRPVCRNHQPPFDAFATLYFHEPDESLWLGSRGSGKSFMSGLHAHMRSRFQRRHGTRVLGGSKAQSQQVYRGLIEAVIDGIGPLSDRATIKELLVERATYFNGSRIEILAASPLSVRGPHVPDLKLDEVDEIPLELREAAYGMAMQKPGGRKSTILLTSTWHNLGGPMTSLVERAQEQNTERPGSFPFYTFCLFEVLEHCPDSRSGRWVGGDVAYEHCPECPLQPFCHADRAEHRGLPRAKRADGHYTIASAIQKVRGLSARAFASDYLCQGPRAEGLIYPEFDESLNVSDVEFDPSLPLHVAIDSGVFAACVLFQVAEQWDRPFQPARHEIRVLTELLAENQPPEEFARQVREGVRANCNDVIHLFSTDPAGDARTAIGRKVIDLYRAGGLPEPRRWPTYPGSVRDGLALVESFVKSADGYRSLQVHRRCRGLIAAFQNYRRAKRAGQWQEYPDEIHPIEDYMDALRGGLMVAFPDGRYPEPVQATATARHFS